MENWNNKDRLPSGTAAMIAMVFGVFGAFLGGSQPLFTGPLSRMLFNADIGFELSILFSALSYVFFRHYLK